MHHQLSFTGGQITKTYLACTLPFQVVQ